MINISWTKFFLFIIILKGYDDTFNQYAHQVHDYKHSEIVFDADFTPMFDPTGGGGTVVELGKNNDYRKVSSFL